MCHESKCYSVNKSVELGGALGRGHLRCVPCEGSRRECSNPCFRGNSKAYSSTRDYLAKKRLRRTCARTGVR